MPTEANAGPTEATVRANAEVDDSTPSVLEGGIFEIFGV
jgi:hypothetical protein